MWGWLTAILKALLPFLWKEVRQPDTQTNEDDVSKIKSRADNDVRNRLRDNNGNDTAGGIS